MEDNINEKSNNGRVPEGFVCELTESLVDTVISGDTLIVYGILKTEFSIYFKYSYFNNLYYLDKFIIILYYLKCFWWEKEQLIRILKEQRVRNIFSLFRC